jgi:hypothetical protein
MPVIFEHPGGVPRFHADDVDGTLYEYGTNRAVGFVADKTVFAMDGTPAFWIGEDDDDRYLHPFDAAQPLRYYFDFLDSKPGAPPPDDEDVKLEDLKAAEAAQPDEEKTEPRDIQGLRQLKREAKKRGGLLPGELEILVLKVGRRAALEVLKDATKKQRSAPRR